MTFWFTEEEAGVLRCSFAFEQQLHQEVSKFQTIQVVQTQAYGRMLILDSCVMLTEADEFIYHELITHIPVCYHPNPRHVVVVGGGDGGTVRELLKHPGIEKITLCEIDGRVIDVCKQYFPKVAFGLNDPRVDVLVADGLAYIASLQAAADLVIVDSTDPIGPGQELFTGDFYKAVARALKPDGLMVAQTESPWFASSLLQRISANIGSGFAYQRPYIGAIPTYPRGLWSWTLAAQKPLTPEMAHWERLEKIAQGLRYLTLAQAQAAFAIPAFYREKFLSS